MSLVSLMMSTIPESGVTGLILSDESGEVGLILTYESGEPDDVDDP